MQTNLLDLLKSKNTLIHYEHKKLQKYLDRGLTWKDLDKWARWYHKRIKNYEMLRANNTKTKDTYMEQIRQQVRRKRKTTMRKMRSLYKQKDTRMDLQTRQ